MSLLHSGSFCSNSLIRNNGTESEWNVNEFSKIDIEFLNHNRFSPFYFCLHTIRSKVDLEFQKAVTGINLIIIGIKQVKFELFFFNKTKYVGKFGFYL